MPDIIIKDLSLKDYNLTERVKNLKDAYFKAIPEVCIERPRLITRYHLENELFEKSSISVLDKAKAYRFALENRTPVVRHTKSYENLSPQSLSVEGMIPFEIKDTSLFAGSTTSKFKGVPLYPEFLALALWPELWTISKRKSNPFYLSEEDAKELNYNIFPHWMENTIQELARKKYRPPEMKVFERLVFFLASKPNCISHTLPDFSKAINKGLRAVINEANEKRASAKLDSQIEFYSAIAESLEGIISYSRNLAIAAKKTAEKESDPVLKKELLDIAGINTRVPEFPARTFREGLTTVWLCWTAIHLENPNVGMSLGRLDQVLYELYLSDIDNEVISIADAIELLCCLWLKIGDHVPTIPEAGEQLFGGTGSNQAITIGGVDKNGNDAVNDLTYIMLRATELMKLRDPNLNARYYPGVSSKEYLERLCDANVNTGATPALHNDKAVIKALTSKGDSIEHARDYGVIGCVEPGSNGRAYGATGAILFNLTSVLELTLYNGRHRHTGMDVLISKETGDPKNFTSFDEFKNAFAEQGRWLVEQAASLNNIFGRIHQDFYPTPILSALFEGPIEKGKDIIQGGAVINSSGATIIGLADVADSLSAIQKVVFEEKIISFAGLLDALNKNFEGYPNLYCLLNNPFKIPKYGNEDTIADANVQWIIELMDKSFGEKENYRGGKYRVGYWTMTNHAGFGRLMKAMPNGRKAHKNFTSGITPVSAVTPVLTKALNSIAKQPVECLSNGVALNLKYTPEYNPLNPPLLRGNEGVVSFDKENEKKRYMMLENFAASVRAYFDGADGDMDSGNGGMEIQFNITTHDTFVDAVKHPKNHLDLLVRVSGYTAYFKDLNPQMQKEIIDRTEYLLSTGRAVYYEPFPLQTKTK